MNSNKNIRTFAEELSKLIGQEITVENIHPMSEGRHYYTQAPEKGSPLLLNHYRGPFFVDIHPDDYQKIEEGEITPAAYILTANWLVGYYWGGGVMVNGGFYQPLDIVGNQAEVKRYLKILSCRSHKISCGYMPSEETCKNCFVENCHFSAFKEGKFENETIKEVDPRIAFFTALCIRFENQFPGYTFRGFVCSNVPDDTIILYPNTRYRETEPFSFTAHASTKVIRDLLSHKVEPENWGEYANSFNFLFHKTFTHECLEATEENAKAVLANVDRVEKKNETEIHDSNSEENNGGIIAKICSFFKNLF